MMKRTFISMVFCSFLLSPFVSLALERGDSWRNLSPKEKDKIQRNYQRWETLPPQNKEHLREEWDRWQRLPPDRRDKLKKRYEEQRRHRSED